MHGIELKEMFETQKINFKPAVYNPKLIAQQ